MRSLTFSQYSYGVDKWSKWLPWISFLFAAAVGISGWAYTLMNKPDETRVIELVNLHAPYARERPLIMRVVERYDDDNAQIKLQLEQIRVSQGQILVKIEELTERR